MAPKDRFFTASTGFCRRGSNRLKKPMKQRKFERQAGWNPTFVERTKIETVAPNGQSLNLIQAHRLSCA